MQEACGGVPRSSTPRGAWLLRSSMLSATSWPSVDQEHVGSSENLFSGLILPARHPVYLRFVVKVALNHARLDFPGDEYFPG